MAQQWRQGRVVGKVAWNDRLVSLRIEADIEPFAAGQFTKLGLEIGGEIVARPYSLVNAPGDQPLEVVFGIVPHGPLSARLAMLEPGAEVLVWPRASGFLVLDEIPAAEHLWMMATGTGIGPFLSILKTAEPWHRFRQVRLVHGVRYAADLIYPDAIRAIAAAHPGQFAFIPVVSREPVADALGGRIPAAITDGTLQALADLPIDAATSQVMLCGNPDMVEDSIHALQERGLRKHRRREPGHISVENYW
jgi:ferredoxin/flavodoxin---NADP+ reductase